jgi:hypothetical protein
LPIQNNPINDKIEANELNELSEHFLLFVSDSTFVGPGEGQSERIIESNSQFLDLSIRTLESDIKIVGIGGAQKKTVH